ncbi:unnamed protein product [Absidia cylindrospora]
MFSFNPFHSFTNKVSQHDPALQQLLEDEKKLKGHWLLLANEQRIAANDLILYGRPLGDDLTDVTQKMGSLMIKWSEMLTNFAGSCDQYQLTLKSISERESTLYSSREKKHRLEESITRLEQDHPGAVDKLADLKQQLASLEQATEVDEREMDNFKRMAVREAFYLLLNGMHEMASKTDVMSSFGKYIVDELDVTPVKDGEERQKYKGSEQTSRILNDASYAVDNWKPDGSKIRRTLTAHHGRNPLVSKNKKLPPAPMPSDSDTPTPAETDDTVTASQEDSDSNDIDNDSDKSTPSSRPPSPQPTQHEPQQPVKQNSLFSLHKPDAVEDSTGDQTEKDDDLPLAPTSPRPQPSPLPEYPYQSSPSQQQGHAGGFSTVYLGLPDHQKLYQFYTNYTPPRPYEEMSRILSPQAVFQPSPQQQQQQHHQSFGTPATPLGRVDAGGFAIRGGGGGNPASYLAPQPSVSTSSVNSAKSNASNGSHGSQPQQQVSSPPPLTSSTSTTGRQQKLESKVSALRAKFQAD